MSNPALVNSTIMFHTNDEDKDDDTHVTVTLRDSNNVVAASLSNDLGHFNDGETNGPFGLIVKNPSTLEDLARGAVEIHVDPNGHDEWHFNFALDLEFNDGSHLSGEANRIVLSHRNRSQTFGLSGFRKS